MRICAAGIAMCLAVAYLTVAPAAASASCGTRGNYFDGMGYLPSVPGVTQWYFRGAGANVVTRVNSLCSSIGTVENFTDAWVMVAARDSRGWAQVGYEMNAVLGSSPRYFAQQYRGDGCPSTYSWCYSTTYWPGGPALNSVHGYWVQYEAACACLKMNVDLTTILQTEYQPSQFWPEPFSIQYAAEVGNINNNVLGTPTSKLTFDALRVEDYGGGWQSIPSPFLQSTNSAPMRWGGPEPTSTTSFRVWTI